MNSTCQICKSNHKIGGFQCDECKRWYCSPKCFLYQPEHEDILTDLDEFWFTREIPHNINENVFQCCKTSICGLCLMKHENYTRCQICEKLFHIDCSGDLDFVNCGCLLCVTYGHPTYRVICYDCHKRFNMEVHPRKTCCCSECIENRSCGCSCSTEYFDPDDFHCESCLIIHDFKQFGKYGPEKSDIEIEYLENETTFADYYKNTNGVNTNDSNILDPISQLYQSSSKSINLDKQVHNYFDQMNTRNDIEIRNSELGRYIEEVHNHSDTLALLYKYIQNNVNPGCNCDYCSYFRNDAPDIDNSNDIDQDLEAKLLMLNAGLLTLKHKF